MTPLPHVTIYIMGLDPLVSLTPMDGIIRSLKHLNWPMTIVGVASDTHDSAGILTEMFDHVIVLRTQNEERYHELVTRTATVPGIKLLIPTDPAEAESMAPHRVWLAESGLLCPGPSPAQTSKGELETMQYLSDRFIGTVKWHRIHSGQGLDDIIPDLVFPLLMSTANRLEQWEIPSVEALRVLAGRCLEKGKIPLVRNLDSESVYQVATVMDSTWKPVGWGMVREIARSRAVEPWMFLSVESTKLLKTAEEVVAALEYQGPVTLRFVYSDRNRSYKLDTFKPILPVWCDLAAHGGVNLPGRLLESVLQMPVTRTPYCAAPGNLITFNSFDISVPSETWLNMAGRGGY